MGARAEGDSDRASHAGSGCTIVSTGVLREVLLVVVLGMAGSPAADLLVGGVGGEAAGVAYGGRVDALGFPEEALGAPEAAHPEDRALHPLREGALQGRAQHLVALGDGHLLPPARQGL